MVFLIAIISFGLGVLGLLFLNDLFVITGFEDNLYTIKYIFIEQSVQVIRVLFHLLFVLLIFIGFLFFVWFLFLSLW